MAVALCATRGMERNESMKRPMSPRVTTSGTPLPLAFDQPKFALQLEADCSHGSTVTPSVTDTRRPRPSRYARELRHHRSPNPEGRDGASWPRPIPQHAPYVHERPEDGGTSREA